jgi:hypothetical protein
MHDAFYLYSAGRMGHELLIKHAGVFGRMTRHTTDWRVFSKLLHSYRANFENPKINLGDVLLLHFLVFYFITST